MLRQPLVLMRDGCTPLYASLLPKQVQIKPHLHDDSDLSRHLPSLVPKTRCSIMATLLLSSWALERNTGVQCTESGRRFANVVSGCLQDLGRVCPPQSAFVARSAATSPSCLLTRPPADRSDPAALQSGSGSGAWRPGVWSLSSQLWVVTALVAKLRCKLA